MNSSADISGGSRHRHPAPAGNTVQDPVCGMKIDPASAAGQVVHNGQTYYFRSEHCLASFQSDPARHRASGA